MLSQVLEPSIQKLQSTTPREEIIFQQDNAPCHTSRQTKTWFDEAGIEPMDWPAQSPDLNPIEHLWGVLGKAIRSMASTSKDNLYKNLRSEWEKISPETCKNLVESMPRRVKAVIMAKGGPTRY